jgi:hypothetical protein
MTKAQYGFMIAGESRCHCTWRKGKGYSGDRLFESDFDRSLRQLESEKTICLKPRQIRTRAETVHEFDIQASGICQEFI